MEYLHNLLNLFVDMSFYMVIGLLFTGLLHLFVKREWIAKQVGNPGLGSTVKASVLGVPLPLCSCGVVPTAIYLGQNGASRGAVTSFLTSTPQTGVDSILATYGLMGPFFALFRPLAAFCSGIITGTLTDVLVKDPLTVPEDAPTSCCCSHETPVVEEAHCCCSHEAPVVEEAHCCCSHEAPVVEEAHCCCSHESPVVEEAHCCCSHEAPVVEESHCCCSHETPVVEEAHCCCSHETPVVEESHCCCSHESPVVEEAHCCCSHEAPVVEESSCCCGSHQQNPSRLKEFFSFTFGEFLDEISLNFLVGLLVAALITTLVPADLLSTFTSPFVGMLLMLVVGIPMYVCSTSSIPIAMSLIAKGITPGAAFVFLFSGPVTNAASLAMLGKALGKKTLAIYLSSVTICALAFGTLLDAIITTLPGGVSDVIATAHGAHTPAYMQVVALLFALALARSLWKKAKQKFA